VIAALARCLVAVAVTFVFYRPVAEALGAPPEITALAIAVAVWELARVALRS
jgi:hypothetical protein